MYLADIILSPSNIVCIKNYYFKKSQLLKLTLDPFSIIFTFPTFYVFKKDQKRSKKTNKKKFKC